MALNKATIIKILELVLVCVLIGMHYHSFTDAGINSAMITMGTFGGYLIILAGIVIGIILGTAIDRRLDMFFSVVGLVLFVISGALILDHFTNSVYHGSFRNTGIAKGCISLVEGVLFLLDAVFSFRGNA
ncbi:PREDICTED: uncharacterized protein LOC108553515 [Eufriesea mexicana]|uniref:uncharacterized protein LOC108553515 n=1 Tax=Eufriesea mexicana TaxID=516756 RepID=UPI00083C1473|nr:PREDICTED: uncharacterized protein LOC108553515 [Eufriesea mexicana]